MIPGRYTRTIIERYLSKSQSSVPSWTLLRPYIQVLVLSSYLAFSPWLIIISKSNPSLSQVTFDHGVYHTNRSSSYRRLLVIEDYTKSICICGKGLFLWVSAIVGI